MFSYRSIWYIDLKETLVCARACVYSSACVPMRLLVFVCVCISVCACMCV
jgi:hypothetical protein